jgi:hypothetical protein
MNNDQLPAKTADHWDEITELRQRMDKAKNAAPTDVERLRQLVLVTPGFLSFEHSATQSIRRQLIEKISVGVSRAAMLAEVDILAKQLDHDAAPPLERLLIDHILTVRLRLIHAEANYNALVVNQSTVARADAEYRENLLSSAQARFVRAIEALARVRRLARNTPALQINIAQDGGKQVNIQGNATGQNAAPAPEPEAGNGC